MEREAKRKRRHPCQNAESDTTGVKLVKHSNDNTMPDASPFQPTNSQSNQQSPYFLTLNQDAASSDKLGQSFFDVRCDTLAKNLLGQYIVRSIGSHIVKGRIVETEAYMGPEDKAAHSYQGKRTPKNESMFMKPGTSYVYNIYGMYCCINISSKGDGSAVLIRALEPIEGKDLMAEGRKVKTDKNKKPFKEKDLTNGPSKLCQALHINKIDFDKVDLTISDKMWIEKGEAVDSGSIVSCPRINIGYADDWKEKPLRFYVKGNPCVSVRDKKAENQLQETDNKKDKT